MTGSKNTNTVKLCLSECLNDIVKLMGKILRSLSAACFQSQINSRVFSNSNGCHI